VLFSSVDIVDTGAGEAVDFLAPGILALAVLSTAFTGQAIATGFERRYGVLKRLASSPLPRWGLMTAKTLSVLVTEVLQVVLLTLIAFALGPELSARDGDDWPCAPRRRSDAVRRTHGLADELRHPVGPDGGEAVEKLWPAGPQVNNLKVAQWTVVSIPFPDRRNHHQGIEPSC
jgi:hypothetical protein